MSIKLIKAKDEDGLPRFNTSMTVVVEADNREELTSLEIRNKVLQFARSQGFPASGLSGVPQPYPVDENGETHEGMLTGEKAWSHWQTEYVVNAGLGAH